MKKLCCFIMVTFLAVGMLCIPVKAANELEFELKYDGDVVINETKDASVILRGTNATTYSNVRVKIEVSGPGTPKLIAKETSSDLEFDLAQTGYWGPELGFPVAGTFENETPIKATFNVAGTYTIKLSLVNMQSSEAEIISETFTIEVLEDATNVNEIEENTIIDNNTENEVDKLPQTGTGVMEYIAYITVIVALIIFVYYKMNIAKK